ncbi:MAG: hypothetical protein HOK89_01840 [Rhodospirillaceae bacterium]|nr:hypothetical protein [Rhodospirillaceae bacterium]
MWPLSATLMGLRIARRSSYCRPDPAPRCGFQDYAAGIAALIRASKKTGNIEVIRLPALLINLQDNNF